MVVVGGGGSSSGTSLARLGCQKRSSVVVDGISRRHSSGVVVGDGRLGSSKSGVRWQQ